MTQKMSNGERLQKKKQHPSCVAMVSGNRTWQKPKRGKVFAARRLPLCEGFQSGWSGPLRHWFHSLFA